MKDWLPNNPKAKLMARKRAAIVKAAKEAFLRDGYAGASMEGIARDAGVSIMTVYRHAHNKDDLFAAVMESACHPADEEERAKIDGIMQKPLGDILAFIGIMFQKRLNGADTTNLLRLVMTELRRFPELGEMAYRGLIGSHQKALLDFLSSRPEAAGLNPAQREQVNSAFFDHLIGLNSYRVLLGLEPATDAEMHERARRAADAMIAALTPTQT